MQLTGCCTQRPHGAAACPLLRSRQHTLQCLRPPPLAPPLARPAAPASAGGRVLAAHAFGHLAPHLGAVVVVAFLQVRKLVLRAARALASQPLYFAAETAGLLLTAACHCGDDARCIHSQNPTRACSLAKQHHDAHTALAPSAGVPLMRRVTARRA